MNYSDIGCDADTGREWEPRGNSATEFFENEWLCSHYLNPEKLAQLQAQHSEQMRQWHETMKKRHGDDFVPFKETQSD